MTAIQCADLFGGALSHPKQRQCLLDFTAGPRPVKAMKGGKVHHVSLDSHIQIEGWLLENNPHLGQCLERLRGQIAISNSHPTGLDIV